MAHDGSRAPSGSRCELIPLKQFDEPRGSLCVAEVGDQISFMVRRAYWIFDVPPGRERARHAHRKDRELLVAVRGSFVVHCDDGAVQTVFQLDSPDTGLLLPRMVFHYLDEFSPGAVCLVLASGTYDVNELVHDYDEFRRLMTSRR